MKDCLHTRLRAIVDDPNLPILETMQQFTLDAIAASGNTSMTDAQKWALNHFFYQIGAISNDGVFAKLEGLYLPMISGDNLTYAMVDYKGNNNLSLTGKKVKFQSHGLFIGDSGTGASVLARNDYAGAVDALSVAALFTENFTTRTNKTIFGFGAASDSLKTIKIARSLTDDYIEIFGKRCNYGSTRSYLGFIATIDDVDYKAKFIESSPFTNTGVTGDADLPSSLANVYMYWSDIVPIGAYSYGSALTDAESEILASALYELKGAFV